MIEYENEKKFMLSCEQYTELLNKLGDSSNKTEQINYYYDTPDEEFRGGGITCRIRQKDDLLIGTVKQHEAGGDGSVEKHFKLGSLPYKMTVDNRQVALLGQLITFRTEYKLSDSMTLMLDKNIYLGTVDYELELEYQKQNEAEATRYIDELINSLGGIGKVTISQSKSERFYQKLHCVEELDSI